jgi:hypothetical protein
MKAHLPILCVSVIASALHIASAHPGSGIVVDEQGQVFFQDSAARTVWKIDTQGKVSAFTDKIGGHWMALDTKGRFARSDLKLVERITPPGISPALIIADGGAPIAMNADGNLYYGVSVSSADKISVGMTKISPDGKQEQFAPDFAKAIEKLGITGLASGPDGTLYVACLTGVMKVTTDGKFTTLVNPVMVKDCDQDAPTSFLRGLDVDSHGTVYAAACGCRCVVKITADGKVETVLKAERPWSPTGVAVHNGEVYVLEYTHANGHLSEGWLPRVRKLGRDSKVTTLAAISREANALQPGKARPQQPLFAPAPGSPIAVAGGPGNVAIGDVNKDGKPDLVVACGGGRSITVLLGQGTGQFRAAPGSPVRVPIGPGEMALGDINSDSKLDMAFASHDSYGVTLLLGDGTGGFARAPNSPVVMKDGQHPHTHGLAMADLNGDSKLDLITVNSEDNDVSVALGDGRGGFTRAPKSPFGVGKSPYPLAVGDLNADGHPDIVATSTAYNANNAPNVLTVLFGDGRGDFRKSEVPLRTGRPWFVAIGDVNGDGKPDLVTTHAEAKPLTMLLGDGKASFTEAADSPFDLGHSAWAVVIADVNRDAKPDVVAAGDGVRVLLGDGRGSFKAAPGSPFPTGKGSWRLAVGDLNGDGKPDVITSNVESENVTVLLAQ